VGAASWGALWISTPARAGWDSLVYHQFAFEYAGLPESDQDALTWELFARYADPVAVSYVSEALDGEPWSWNLTPERKRWELQYRMRPAYPALVAALYPALGIRAPLAVSLGTVMLFTVTTYVGTLLLAGKPAAVLALVLGVLNVAMTPWLVALATDGLAIALWAVVLTSGALWIERRRPTWLLLTGLAVLALCWARPLGLLAPILFGLCTVAAALTRAPQWRAFLTVTAVSAAPAIAVVAFFAAAGFPGFLDLLQDLPTHHFVEPDIADPIGWVIGTNSRQLLAAPTELVARPLVFGALVGGAAGLVLVKRWWTAPFLAAFVVVYLSYMLHPVTSELARTVAPLWVSVHLGLALLAVTVARQWPQAINDATRWLGQGDADSRAGP
jgi:hypothetical protein